MNRRRRGHNRSTAAEDTTERLDRELRELFDEVRVAIPALRCCTPYHRMRFRDGDKERQVVAGTRMAIGSLVLLLLAVTGVVCLVGDLLFANTLAAGVAALVALWFGWFWFGLALSRKAAD